jgi:5-methylcytosine-specific restriction protein A
MAERSFKNVTRDAVLRAMAEYDELGQPRFLEKYGFHPAREYTVWNDGKAYDSKAIIGAAFGYLPGHPAPLAFAEFSGGANTVVPLLEKFGFSFQPPPTEAKRRNPPWNRDELILALDLYIRHGGSPLGPAHPDVVDLSALLNRLAANDASATFRNPNGVAMKLMNFRSLDPAFVSKGGVGLSSIGKGDKAIWAEFAHRPQDLAVAAEIIRAVQGAIPATSSGADDADLDEFSAQEGGAAYRTHRVYERNGQIVALRKRSALEKLGRLSCEACEFDFATVYGPRGYGFIEAHHTKPVHAMKDGEVTRLDDLALLCSNCHRMVHSTRPWLSLEELRRLVGR